MVIEAVHKKDPSPEDWEQIRLRLKALEVVHARLVATIPGYRGVGSSIYEHFYGNAIKTIGIYLDGEIKAPAAEAYRECLIRVTQIERYHRLFETNSAFAERECSRQSLNKPNLSNLEHYLDEAEVGLKK